LPGRVEVDLQDVKPADEVGSQENERSDGGGGIPVAVSVAESRVWW